MMFRKGTNSVLSLLPEKSRQAILERCEKRMLKLGRPVYESGARVAHVFLPLSAMISMVIDSPEGGTVEVAVIGNEGVAGAHVALGAERSPWRGVVQLEGEALRMSVKDFREAMHRHPGFANLVHRFAHALTVQISQSVVCNCLHSVEQRLCRWLLMANDRAGTASMRMTQDFVAHMLGVHRSTVTVAAGILQKAGLIRYSHGKITVLDRKRLEHTACDCYGLADRELRALLRSRDSL